MAKYNLIPNYCILDFETSGLAPNNAKYSSSSITAITQVAFILVDGREFKELARYQSYVAPYDLALEYQKKAEEISGISKAYVEKNGESLEKVVNDISQIIDTYNHGFIKTVIIGKNILFDIDYLCDIYRRRKSDISKFFNCTKILGVDIPRHIDIMDLSKLSDTSFINYKLGALCKAHDIDYVDAHDAMNDIQFTLELFKKLIGKLQDSGNLFEGQAIESVRTRFEF
jgi:DNA polymerase III alpha subunit (gram-positive type)